MYYCPHPQIPHKNSCPGFFTVICWHLRGMTAFQCCCTSINTRQHYIVPQLPERKLSSVATQVQSLYYAKFNYVKGGCHCNNYILCRWWMPVQQVHIMHMVDAMVTSTYYADGGYHCNNYILSNGGCQCNNYTLHGWWMQQLHI